MKKCTKCKNILPKTEYYKHNNMPDGLQAWCKSCKLDAARTWRKTDKGKRLNREYGKKYRATEQGKKVVKRIHAKALKKYRCTEKGRAINRKMYRKSYQKSSDRYSAKSAVHYAVRKGKLPHANQFICTRCNSTEANLYHHPRGYKNGHKLDVVPLCFQCHQKVHNMKETGWLV